MIRLTLLAAVVLAALSAIAGPAPAQPAEAPSSDDIVLLVHVRNGSTGNPAEMGLPVMLSAEAAGQWMDILEGRTLPGGVARFDIPLAMARRVAFLCTVTYGEFEFPGRPFQVDPDRPMNMILVTVYEPQAGLGLPSWTAAALTVVFALAIALIAIRRSDRQLT